MGGRAHARRGIGKMRPRHALREPLSLYSDRRLDYGQCVATRVPPLATLARNPYLDEEVPMNRRDRRSELGWLFLAALGTVALTAGAPAEAQLAISANDNKLTLVNGVAQVVQNPAPDTITIINLSAPGPRVVVGEKPLDPSGERRMLAV